MLMLSSLRSAAHCALTINIMLPGKPIRAPIQDKPLHYLVRVCVFCCPSNAANRIEKQWYMLERPKGGSGRPQRTHTNIQTAHAMNIIAATPTALQTATQALSNPTQNATLICAAKAQTMFLLLQTTKL